MKKIVLSFFLALLAISIQAQDGRTVYNFLRLPVSAHGAALGGNNISLVEDDESMIFHNPSLLSNVSDKTILINYMNYMAGVNTASAAFNKVIKERASVAFSGQYINYGSMKEMNADNIQNGEFSAKDISIAGYFSYLLTDRITGGVAAKFITSYIGEYNSLALGVDLGLNYYHHESELSISLVAKNLGGQVKSYDDNFERMPMDLQVGISKRLVHTPLRFSATLTDLTHWNYKFIQHLSAGAELILSPQIWIGAGYNFRRAKEMSIENSDHEKSSNWAGFSLGAGLSLNNFKLNFAYGKYHVSSSSILINIAYTL
jgi:opacity protein-like surface antigen